MAKKQPIPKEIKDFLESVAPDTQVECIEQYKQMVRKALEDAESTIIDDTWSMEEYWAWRIAFFTHWANPDEIKLEIIGKYEPEQIIIKFKPDYGS